MSRARAALPIGKVHPVPSGDVRLCDDSNGANPSGGKVADLAAPLVEKTAVPDSAANAEPETGRHRASRQVLKTLQPKGLLLGVAGTLQTASTVDATDAKWPAAVVSDGPWAQRSLAMAPSNRRPLPTTTPPCRRPNVQRNRGRDLDDVAPDDVRPLHQQADDRFQATDLNGDHEDLETAPDVRNAPPCLEINDAYGAANAPGGVRSTQSQHHCTQE
jgi:hypothetical protein